MQPPLQMENIPSQADARVLYVYDGEFAVDNGVSNYIRTLGQYAAESGCSVNYLVGRDTSQEPNTISVTQSVPVFANGSHSYVPTPASSRRISEVIEELAPDIVHVQAPFLPTMAGKVVKELDKATTLVGTFHTPMPRGWLRAANELNARLIRKELGRFDHLYSVSETARVAAQEIYGVDSEIVPCPVSLASRPEGSAQTDGPEDKIIITYLGRLVGRKSLPYLADGLGALEPEIKEKLQFQVVGGGDERALVAQRIAANGLDASTVFTGRVTEDEKHDLLVASDIVTCSSNGGESLGITLIEAMAAGKPVVIANKVGGYADVLREVPESLVEPGDPRILAKHLSHIISDEGARRAIFEAQQEIVKGFDIQFIGPRIMAAYGLDAAGSKQAGSRI